MDRSYVIAPAIVLVAGLVAAFVVYCGLCVIGRPPRVKAVRHNQLIGPFMAGFLVWLVGPIERALVGRVTPNTLTAMSLVTCAATGVAMALGHLAAAVWLYVAAGILDILDGRIARVCGTQTAAGALFDSVSDRWGELFVFLGYAWYVHETPWLLAVVAAFGASMMVSYTRARAEGLGVRVSGGLMQRAERIVLVTGGTLLAVCLGGAFALPIVGATMLICALASTATAVHRCVVAFKVLAEREAEPIEIEDSAPIPLPPQLAALSAPELPRVLN